MRLISGSHVHEKILAVILCASLVVLSMKTDKFMTVDNILNQGRLFAEIGLVALPMTLIIVTGGIDLAVGSILGLSAIVLGITWKNLGMPLGVAMGTAVFAGVCAGLVNGFLVTRMRVPPLITTLATLGLFRGLAEGLSQARSVRGYPEWFYFLGQGEIHGVPVQLLILVLAIVAFWFLLA